VDVDVDGAREQEGVAVVDPGPAGRADVLDAAVLGRQAGPLSRSVRSQKLTTDLLGD
jgi:hypothetical protein